MTSRPSWCYGTVGIARAQQLAAIATDDPRRADAAEDALAACLTDKQLGRITCATAWPVPIRPLTGPPATREAP